MFAEQLSTELLKTFESAIKDGELPPSMTETVITLILKKGKDPQECGSYRPISLLCCDIKLLTKIVAIRVNRIIKLIIEPDQVGFVKGRKSSDNLRRLLHMMWTAKDLSSSVAALSLDAEKAFDRVSWGYLTYALKRFGFGCGFRGIISLIYNHPISMVTTNGLRSTPFPVSRGTKQGCPLSPLLFIIALEPLAEAIRSHNDIKGLSMGSTDQKLLLFADDLLVILSQPEESVPSLLDLVDRFSEISGYKVNWGKSEVMPLSRHCHKEDFQKWKFQWVDKNMKYLGIFLNPGLKNMIKDNFDPLLEKIKLLFKSWDKLLISLWGRVQIIKMVITPKLLYPISMLPLNIPVSIFKSIDKMFSEFIWAGKRARMKLCRLQATTRKGGLRLPNIKLYQEAFLVAQIVSLLSESMVRPTWVDIEEEINAPFRAADYLSQNTHLDNPIMKHTKTVWHSIHQREKSCPYLINSASLWNNPSLKIGGKSFYWREWRNKGINNIGCLYEGEILKSFDMLKNQFNLPKNDFWKYLQLRNCILKASKDGSRSAPQSDICNFVIKICGLPHAASFVYSYLITRTSTSTEGLKIVWERDLGVSFEDEEWNTLVEEMLHPMRDARSKLIQYKILNRVYLTPTRLRQMKLMPTGLCWRCNSSQGDIVHMFFSCASLNTFWYQVMGKISSSLGKEITINPSLCLLNKIDGIEGISPRHLAWLQIAITTAKRVILRHWKDTVSPSYREWYNTLAETASFERLIYKINDKLHVFSDIWEPFLDAQRVS